MAISWDVLQKRYDQLSEQLVDPALEVSKRQALQKEFSHLSNLLERHATIERLQFQLTHAKEQGASTTDPELAELFALEVQELEQKLHKAEQDLDEFMFPPDEHDNRSVFLEIRAGTGGQEAALFAADLMKMYTNYAMRKNWKATVDEMSSTDLGGLREVVLHIQGKGVYGHLKFESGVHRVQRVPTTETAGRIHTSTATVAVLPEADEVDVTINPADLRIDAFRASGAGGQHVNKTESAIRITHIPTGIAVACQEDRSQHKNRAKAMKLLQSRLLAVQMEKQHEEMSKKRKEQVGTGERAEKVRTYNFPQNRVTDHQIDLTLKKLDYVMQGDMDDLIEPLRERARQKRKEEAAAALGS